MPHHYGRISFAAGYGTNGQTQKDSRNGKHFRKDVLIVVISRNCKL